MNALGLALIFGTWLLAYSIVAAFPPQTTAGLAGVLLLGWSGSLAALGLCA